MVIYNKTLDFYHLYVHFQKDKVYVPLETPSWQARNSAWSGIQAAAASLTCTWLSAGAMPRIYRPLPMTFSKIKNGAGTVVTGVPVEGEFYG